MHIVACVYMSVLVYFPACVPGLPVCLLHEGFWSSYGFQSYSFAVICGVIQRFDEKVLILFVIYVYKHMYEERHEFTI